MNKITRTNEVSEDGSKIIRTITQDFGNGKFAKKIVTIEPERIQATIDLCQQQINNYDDPNWIATQKAKWQAKIDEERETLPLVSEIQNTLSAKKM